MSDTPAPGASNPPALSPEQYNADISRIGNIPCGYGNGPILSAYAILPDWAAGTAELVGSALWRQRNRCLPAFLQLLIGKNAEQDDGPRHGESQWAWDARSSASYCGST